MILILTTEWQTALLVISSKTPGTLSANSTEKGTVQLSGNLVHRPHNDSHLNGFHLTTDTPNTLCFWPAVCVVAHGRGNVRNHHLHSLKLIKWSHTHTHTHTHTHVNHDPRVSVADQCGTTQSSSRFRTHDPPTSQKMRPISTEQSRWNCPNEHENIVQICHRVIFELLQPTIQLKRKRDSVAFRFASRKVSACCRKSKVWCDMETTDTKEQFGRNTTIIRSYIFPAALKRSKIVPHASQFCSFPLCVINHAQCNASDSIMFFPAAVK